MFWEKLKLSCKSLRQGAEYWVWLDQVIGASHVSGAVGEGPGRGTGAVGEGGKEDGEEAS